MTDEEPWLDVETQVGDADPQALAAVLESVAEALREAPEGRRYNADVLVTEMRP